MLVVRETPVKTKLRIQKPLSSLNIHDRLNRA